MNERRLQSFTPRTPLLLYLDIMIVFLGLTKDAPKLLAQRSNDDGYLILPPALTHHDQPFAIFLDIDGTLIDIASTPQGVVAPRKLARLLGQLFDVLGGAVAIISGRPASDVDRLLTPLKLPVAGVHGAEIRFDIGGDIKPTADALDPLMVAAVLKLGEIDPGIIIEA